MKAWEMSLNIEPTGLRWKELEEVLGELLLTILDRRRVRFLEESVVQPIPGRDSTIDGVKLKTAYAVYRLRIEDSGMYDDDEGRHGAFLLELRKGVRT